MDPEIRPTDEWTTATPETYCIDYGHDHRNNAAYLAQMTADPPTVVHVGWDTVINNMFGAIEYAGEDIFDVRRLSPPELQQRIGELRHLLDGMHAAGIKTVMPYQSGMFYFGNHEKRSGLWETFDHWEEYAEFGLGARPTDDPAEWQGRDRRPHPGRSETFVYEPCINHPGWRQWMRMTTSWLARVGFDAAFSDVNAHCCYKPSCQAAFRRYLCAKYAPADLQRLFGFNSPEDVRMGKSGDGLLYTETLRHWGISFAEFFAEMTAAGQCHKPGFFILPNLSSYANVNEIYKRRRAGHYLQPWARACPIFMYEKMEQPGRLGRTAISDSILQYKFAFANRTRAGLLLYNAQDAHSIALSNAEAAAMGGGSFIQSGYQCAEVRSAYRAFFESNDDLLAGYTSHAQVAVVFLFDEVYWEDPTHLEQVFVLKDYLCNHHVLWDLVVERNFSRHELSKHAVVIVPGAQHLSDAQVDMLKAYAKGGGGVVMIGEAGRFTEEGARRDELPLADQLTGAASSGVRSAKLGKGWVLHAVKIEDVVERPAFELFQLTEDEANETAIILRMAKAAEARKQPQGTDRLLKLCEKMGAKGLVVAAKDVPFTLRAFAYKRRDAEGRRLTVHLLNYDLAIRQHTRRPGIPAVGEDPQATHRSDPPIPAANVALSIPLPAGWKPAKVELRGPQAVPGATLPFAVKGGRLIVTVPHVETYEVLNVGC